MIRNSRNYISDHLATKQNKSHEMLANVTPHVTRSQNVPYTGEYAETREFIHVMFNQQVGVFYQGIKPRGEDE